MKNEKGEFYDNILNIFNTKGKNRNYWQFFYMILIQTMKILIEILFQNYIIVYWRI